MPSEKTRNADEGAGAGGPDAVIGDESALITLPPDLYWDFVHPFVPLDNRPILNKRTGSTQFYSGDRAELDLAFLEKWGRVLGFTGIPRSTGEIGTTSFRIDFDRYGNKKYDENDPDGTLTLLRNVRREWDEHLSMITSPSARLHACLEMFVDDNHPDYPVMLPLFFLGDGGVKDVVDFHVSMNPWSINGPAPDMPMQRYYAPYTLLGYWVDQYLGSDHEGFVDGACYDITNHYCEVALTLIGSNAADVVKFFEPRAGIPWGLFYSRYFQRGDCLVECMQSCLTWHENEFGQTLDGLCRVICTLYKTFMKTRPPLQYDEGDWVEIRYGTSQSDDSTWVSGWVAETWASTTRMYGVILDEGDGMVMWIDDADDIRAWSGGNSSEDDDDDSGDDDMNNDDGSSSNSESD